MKSTEIRQAFLEFFRSKGHEIVPSSSLIPGNDPTLLFTNAGMVQFKDVFLGDDPRDYSRATSSQRCVRAGGKHNDLENVGYTARHHTFFEMLGNFSFGDYFKRDAIAFAWELLTTSQWLNLPIEKLLVTVYEDDDEAFGIWRDEIGLPETKIIRIGDKDGKKYQSDNFWAMGDTGPCGPCTEIFYDHGDHIWGGPPGSPEEDGDRFIEIWNIVFMQFNRSANGDMAPLPKPSVDTGMGLERISAVLQGVHSNYEIDLFVALLAAVADVTGAEDRSDKSLRVIADHIRSSAFLICDDVLPSNEGRGYVLRRIIRRAVRHGHKLGCKEPFFYRLVAELGVQMGDAYPELLAKREQVERILLAEEQQFAKTLDKGLGVLEGFLAELESKVIPGDVLFTLYDTYGFPLDLTADIAREKGLDIDSDGYEAAMEAQRERGRASSAFKVDYNAGVSADESTEFVGYKELTADSRISAIFKDGIAVESLSAGESGAILLDATPFYAESGGQVGDTGVLDSSNGTFRVSDCTKDKSNHIHLGEIERGSLSVGEKISARVDVDKRQSTALNHSATHLMHAALREVLGDHVTQKGSLVDSSRLRFDFSHFEPVTEAQLRTIEMLVNSRVLENTEVGVDVCDMESAKARGAMALFGEKYGDEVRVLSMGNGFSVELCGGTHVARTGDIGQFRIVSESGVAAGVRRIEAVTGFNALQLSLQQEQKLDNIARLVKSTSELVEEKTEQLVAQNKSLEKEVASLKSKLATAATSDLASSVVEVNGVKVLSQALEGADAKALRESADQLKSKLAPCVLLLAGTADDRIALIAAVSNDLTTKVEAGELMRFVAPALGGKGGGRKDMAQGGGTDFSKLDSVLASVTDWVAEKLAK